LQDIIRNAPDIIREAARSSLGLAALIILALAIIGVIFFKKEEVRLKTLMYILMFIGFIVLGYAFSHVSNSSQIPDPAPTSTISPSLPNTPTPTQRIIPPPATPISNTLSPTPTPPQSRIIDNEFASPSLLCYQVQWHIKAIQPEEKFTRFYIEIKNIDDQHEHFFFSFNDAPIAVIGDGDNGGYYPMLGSIAPPEGIREQDRSWFLQPKRAITLVVSFAPLAKGITSGRIAYRDNYSAEPAKFSFAQ
jgi:hypothetical protein